MTRTYEDGLEVDVDISASLARFTRNSEGSVERLHER